MNKNQLCSLIQNITVWKRGVKRAPHKPLLLLYALARSQQHRDRFIPYGEIDKKLTQLLMDFGPSRKSYSPEYPFWRLRNDGIWDLKNVKNVRVNSSGDPRKSDLIEQNVSGGLATEIFNFLKAHSETIVELAESILEANFPHPFMKTFCRRWGWIWNWKRLKRPCGTRISETESFRPTNISARYAALTSGSATPWSPWRRPTSSGIRRAGRMWRKMALPFAHSTISCLTGVRLRFRLIG